MNERTHFFIKIYLSPGVCERWVKTGTDCYIDPTSLLDHSMLCYLQEPTEHFFHILAGVAQPGVAEGCCPQWGIPRLQAGSPSCLQLNTLMLYTHNHNIDLLTLMNERTHFFIKIYLSHFILDRVMFLLCMREVLLWSEEHGVNIAGDRDRLLYWPQVLLTIAALLPHLGWVAGSLRACGPQSASWFSLWFSNWLQPPRYLVILLSHTHLLPLFFRLFTLGQGSIYNNNSTNNNVVFYFKFENNIL